MASPHMACNKFYVHTYIHTYIRHGATSSNYTNTPLLVWNKVIRPFWMATTEVCMKDHYFWKWPLTYAHKNDVNTCKGKEKCWCSFYTGTNEQCIRNFVDALAYDSRWRNVGSVIMSSFASKNYWQRRNRHLNYVNGEKMHSCSTRSGPIALILHDCHAERIETWAITEVYAPVLVFRLS